MMNLLKKSSMCRVFITILLASTYLLSQGSSDIIITPIRPVGKCPNGAIDLVIAGGVGPFDVTWRVNYGSSVSSVFQQNNGLPGNDGREDVDELPSGSYTVSIVDAVCGEFEQTIDLRPGLFETGGSRVLVSVQNVKTCGDKETGTNDGSITFETLVGTPGPFSLSWSGPGIPAGTNTTTISNLRDGLYTLTVTTSDGCEFVKKITVCCCEVQGIDGPKTKNKCGSEANTFPITIYQDLLYSPDTRQSYNGRLRIRTSGGTASNSVLWSGPDGFTSTDLDIQGLGVGEFCVRVEDGCSDDERCYELVDCSEKPVTMTGVPGNTCRSRTGADINAGFINLTVNGGWPPFTYQWSDGSTQEDLMGLSAGTYCVTVSDSKGCRPTTQCFVIDYNAMVPLAAQDNRCGQAWYCNGVEYQADFQPVQTYIDHDDPDDCTIRHEYCPFNTPDRRMPTIVPRDPLRNLRWDNRRGFDPCNIVGDCPDGRGVQIAVEGEERRLWTVFLRNSPRCPGNARCPVCFKADVCEAFFQGQRRIRPLDQSWIETNESVTNSFVPGTCGDACVLQCGGEIAQRPDLSGDYCVECIKSNESLQQKVEENPYANLTVADFILADYNQGSDVFNTSYTFSEGSTLATILADAIPSQENLRWTKISGFSFQDLEDNATGKIEYAPLGKREIELNYSSEINLSPNPTSSDFSITFSDLIDFNSFDVTVSLIDMNGKLVKSELYQKGLKLINISVAEIPSGVYLVKISGPFPGFAIKRITIIK